MFLTVFTMLFEASRKVASIANLMKKVWMQLQRTISSPSPAGRGARPMRPLNRSNKRRATRAFVPQTSTVSATLSMGGILHETPPWGKQNGRPLVAVGACEREKDGRRGNEDVCNYGAEKECQGEKRGGEIGNTPGGVITPISALRGEWVCGKI